MNTNESTEFWNVFFTISLISSIVTIYKSFRKSNREIELEKIIAAQEIALAESEKIIKGHEELANKQKKIIDDLRK